MLKDRVHHLGVTGAHSLVQHWKAKRCNLITLYSHTYSQIPKPAWKVSLCIEGQKISLKWDRGSSPTQSWPPLLTLTPTWLRTEYSQPLEQTCHYSLSPVSYYWLWNPDGVFTAGFHCVITQLWRWAGRLCAFLLSQSHITGTGSTRACRTSVVVVLWPRSLWLFTILWTAALQVPLSFSVSGSLLKFRSIESVMLSTISSSATLFSCPQSFPASEFLPNELGFRSGGKVLELRHQSFQWIFRVDFL